MKLIITRILPFILMTYVLSSCLKGNDANFPVETATSGSQLSFIFNPTGTSGNFNSGLEYFPQGALTFPAADATDSLIFVASLQGPNTLGKDITVTLVIDNSKLNDNFATDSITYEQAPDSIFHIVNMTAVIPAGQRSAVFKIVVHPNKIDIARNFGLPVTMTNDAGVPVSNHGTLYFHAIGNPIAGGYNWDFIRYSNPAGTGSPDGNSFSGKTTVFSPASPTFVKVPMGYYDHANYFITFKNAGGVLTNFKAQIDPAEVSGPWATAGISVVQAPTILVENNYTKFTLHFTTTTRNCTDIYYK